MSERRSVGTQTEWWQAYIGDCGCEKPSKLSQLLAETIPAEPRTKKLLDIGCGTGVIGLYCLLEKKAVSVTFTDVLHEWIEITHDNIDLKIEEGVIAPSQVEVTDAMPFDRIPSEVVAQHDLVVFNLPQFPEDFVSPGELSKIAADPIRARYRLAGGDGLKLARDFCHWYVRLRQPRPDAIFVLWSILGKRQIAEALKSDSFQWKTIQKTPIPLKPEFSHVAEEFFRDAEETNNRMLAKDGDGWTIQVLTINLTGI